MSARMVDQLLELVNARQIVFTVISSVRRTKNFLLPLRQEMESAPKVRKSMGFRSWSA